MTFKEFVTEDFYSLVQRKNQWVDLSDNPEAKHDPALKQNLFDLVNMAYTKTLGEPNYGIKSTAGVLSPDYNFWEAIDIDENPDAEACMFGRRKNGIKISGIGHNGEKISISILVNSLAKKLQQQGYWIEAAGRVAEVMKIKGAPIYKNPNAIPKLFPGAELKQWNDDGSYIRTIPFNQARPSSLQVTGLEYVFGHPIV